jgi:hypothetical protein
MSTLLIGKRLIYGGIFAVSFLCLLIFHSKAQAPVVDFNPALSATLTPADSALVKKLKRDISRYQDKIKALKFSFQKLQPSKPFLIVNTSWNEITLVKNGCISHKGRCSSGSYVLLKAGNQRQWLFKTPRGVFRVTVKLTDPWWYKPDWAYLEEGLPIPSIYSPKRYQPGVLGDYALGFGSGYLVHGTLYKRLLGMPVTHGCVRLDDDDMHLVFNTLTHGSRIYIY